MSLLLALTAGGGAGSVSGTLALTLDGVSVSSSGVVGHSGTIAATLDGVAVASSGVAGHVGTSAITLDGIAFSATGTGGTVQETGGAGPSRPKRVYIERDGKILVFANPSRAANYISAEKQAQQVVASAKQASVVAPQRTKQAEVRAIHQPIETIAFDAIASVIEQYRLAQDISALIQAHELDAIMALYQKARELQDEEDIELLLLAA